MQAVCQMLMGKTVIHISASYRAAQDARLYAMEWLEDNELVDQPVLKVTASATVIRFGSGSVQFTHTGLNCARLVRDRTFKDHHVLECEAAAAYRLERVAAKEQIQLLMNKHGWECVQPSLRFEDGRKEFWLNQTTRDED